MVNYDLSEKFVTTISNLLILNEDDKETNLGSYYKKESMIWKNVYIVVLVLHCLQ